MDAYHSELQPSLVVGSAFIDYENSNYEYFIPKRVALNAYVDRWEFLVVDADQDEILLYGKVLVSVIN